MNAATLDTYFTATFNTLSGNQQPSGMANGSLQPLPGLYFNKRSFSYGSFTLNAAIGSGINQRVIRSKSFTGSGISGVSGVFVPKLPPERQWDNYALTSYYQAQMDGIFTSLPATTQAIYAQTYVAAKDFVSRACNDVAAALISNTAVTDNLTGAKNQLLSFL
jgi:hypothetical protein